VSEIPADAVPGVGSGRGTRERDQSKRSRIVILNDDAERTQKAVRRGKAPYCVTEKQSIRSVAAGTSGLMSVNRSRPTIGCSWSPGAKRRRHATASPKSDQVLIRRQPSHRSRSFARGKAKKPITGLRALPLSGCDPPVAADFFYVWAIMVSNSLTFWTLALAEKVTCY